MLFFRRLVQVDIFNAVFLLTFYIILEYFISLHVCKNGNKLCWEATCQG